MGLREQEVRRDGGGRQLLRGSWKHWLMRSLVLEQEKEDLGKADPEPGKCGHWGQWWRDSPPCLIVPEAVAIPWSSLIPNGHYLS